MTTRRREIIDEEDGSTTTITTAPDGTTTAITTADGNERFVDRRDGSAEPWFAGIAILMPVMIVAIVFISKLLQTRIAVRHGYPIKVRGTWVQPGGGPDAKRATELMAGENEKLRGQVGRLEERVAVLERIVTDPARRVSEEIEALRG